MHIYIHTHMHNLWQPWSALVHSLTLENALEMALDSAARVSEVCTTPLCGLVIDNAIVHYMLHSVLVYWIQGYIYLPCAAVINGYTPEKNDNSKPMGHLSHSHRHTRRGPDQLRVLYTVYKHRHA